MKSFYHSHYLIQRTKFNHNAPDHFSLRYADITISIIGGRPPSWICDDIIILYPVIAFHGPNTVRNFHVDWFDSFHTNLTYATDIQTDRQTDIVIA